MASALLRRGFELVLCLLLCLSLSRCAPLPPRPEKLPPFHGFDGVTWGTPLEEAKKKVKAEGKVVFEERTSRPPFAFYATGTYVDSPALFTYFFTPKSKKLYRVDVTLNDPMVHKSISEDFTKKFGPPAHSQGNVDHWSWTDKTVVILQIDPEAVQIAYSDGAYALLNHQEGDGLVH